MARCAVIDIETNKVINLIMAEETDLAPDGCYLKNIDNVNFEVVIGSPWGGLSNGN